MNKSVKKLVGTSVKASVAALVPFLLFVSGSGYGAEAAFAFNAAFFLSYVVVAVPTVLALEFLGLDPKTPSSKTVFWSVITFVGAVLAANFVEYHTSLASGATLLDGSGYVRLALGSAILAMACEIALVHSEKKKPA